jgi:hypothetical protein
MDKLSKFNNRIFLLIKKIKNLQAQEKGKLKCETLNKRKIKLVELDGKEENFRNKIKAAFTCMKSIKLSNHTVIVLFFPWDFGITTQHCNLKGNNHKKG